MSIMSNKREKHRKMHESDDQMDENHNPIEQHVGLDGQFRVQLLIKALTICYSNGDDDVYIQDYVGIVKEVKKIINSFGFLFSFVDKELNDKICVLEEHYRKDPEHYETVDKMLKYEKESNLLYPSKLYNKKNATKNLLELHRPLIFLYVILEKLYHNPNERASKLSIETYDATLAKYHYWIIRKMTRTAMLALPRRETLLGLVFKSPEEYDLFSELVEKCKATSTRVENIYIKYDLLDLPVS